ncbi:hypothetical protein L195_g028885, partial [Trifolium pratense]
VQNHSAVVSSVQQAVWLLVPETGRVKCNVDACHLSARTNDTGKYAQVTVPHSYDTVTRKITPPTPNCRSLLDAGQ